MGDPTSISTSCTVQRRNGKFCDARAEDDMPFPICQRHAIKLFRHMLAFVRAADDSFAFRSMFAVSEVERLPRILMDVQDKTVGPDPLVYYVRLDRVIKIGTTTNLTVRLRGYPPHAELLATEPGGKDREVERHRQFAKSLAHGREWFKPTPDLLQHIASLRRSASGKSA